MTFLRTHSAAAMSAAILVFMFCGGQKSSAWGFDAHRFIVEQAIEQLPPSMRPFYQKHRTFVVEHSIDPDLWRNVGFADEPPRHFLDLDAYGSPPFSALPRDYESAVAKFGMEMIVKNGLLPWRAAEIFDRLTQAFTRLAGGTETFGIEDIKFLSAVLAHYVSDAHVPFHAALNYDGQLTGQHGIHSRFETELFERFRSRLHIAPQPLIPIESARDFVFETLITGFPLVDSILKADRAAIGSDEVYTDRYFESLFKDVQPILEMRLNRSIVAVASIIASAWERGGRPSLPVDPPRPLKKVKGKREKEEGKRSFSFCLLPFSFTG